MRHRRTIQQPNVIRKSRGEKGCYSFFFLALGGGTPTNSPLSTNVRRGKPQQVMVSKYFLPLDPAWISNWLGVIHSLPSRTHLPVFPDVLSAVEPGYGVPAAYFEVLEILIPCGCTRRWLWLECDVGLEHQLFCLIDLLCLLQGENVSADWYRTPDHESRLLVIKLWR
jgi:hypothetical protein